MRARKEDAGGGRRPRSLVPLLLTMATLQIIVEKISDKILLLRT
jgi:hypothetical protein